MDYLVDHMGQMSLRQEFMQGWREEKKLILVVLFKWHPFAPFFLEPLYINIGQTSCQHLGTASHIPSSSESGVSFSTPKNGMCEAIPIYEAAFLEMFQNEGIENQFLLFKVSKIWPDLP